MRELRPGATAILTRASEDNEIVARRLRDDGVRVLELPCVRTMPLDDDRSLAQALRALTSEDWLVVTSRAGADAVARAARASARVAAIGAATAARLLSYGVAVDFTPSLARGELLGRELPVGRVALLARSDRALPDLPEILRERGFAVREVVAYRTVVGTTGDVGPARDALESGGAVAIFFWSPGAIDGLLRSIPRSLVGAADVFVGGEATRAAARERLGPAARIATIDEEVTRVTHR